MKPLLDLRPLEAPAAPDPEGGKLPTLSHPVDCNRMKPKVRGDFLDRQDIRIEGLCHFRISLLKE